MRRSLEAINSKWKQRHSTSIDVQVCCVRAGVRVWVWAHVGYFWRTCRCVGWLWRGALRVHGQCVVGWRQGIVVV